MDDFKTLIKGINKLLNNYIEKNPFEIFFVKCALSFIGSIIYYSIGEWLKSTYEFFIIIIVIRTLITSFDMIMYNNIIIKLEQIILSIIWVLTFFYLIIFKI